MAAEPITLPAESVGEMPVASLTLPVLATIGLRIITNPISPTLVIEPVFPEIVTSPTSIVAGVLVSMKTPPRSPAISHLSADSETGGSLVFRNTRSPRVVEAEKEFVAEMVDSFYKSLM